jgi:hypothetical protein
MTAVQDAMRGSNDTRTESTVCSPLLSYK